MIIRIVIQLQIAYESVDKYSSAITSLNSVNGISLNFSDSKLPLDTLYEKNRLIIPPNEKFEMYDMELIYEIDKHNAGQYFSKYTRQFI